MKPLDKLVHGVIWPAVAGSILWTFLLVVIEPHGADVTIWPRLLVLLLVGVYLAIDWVDTDGVLRQMNRHSWLADIPLAASLSTFAVATQFHARWSAWALGFAFAFAVIGHAFGAWDLRKPSSSSTASVTLAGINWLGLAVLLMARPSTEWFAKWSEFIAMAVVVVLYALCRKGISMGMWPFGSARG
jgi:hypothetical protein